MLSTLERELEHTFAKKDVREFSHAFHSLIQPPFLTEVLLTPFSPAIAPYIFRYYIAAFVTGADPDRDLGRGNHSVKIQRDLFFFSVAPQYFVDTFSNRNRVAQSQKIIFISSNL